MTSVTTEKKYHYTPTSLQKYTNGKAWLHCLQLSYAMLHSAKLRVTTDGQSHYCESAAEAASWLDRNENSMHHRLAAEEED